jgi:ATP-binding cassette subfamily B protein
MLLIKLIKYLNKTPFSFYFGVLFIIIGSALPLLIPIYIGECIDRIITGEIYTDLIVKIVVVTIISTYLQWQSRVLCAKSAQNSVKLIRKEIPQNKESVSLIVNDAEIVANGLIMGISQIISSVTVIGFTLYFMFDISRKISFVVMLLTPVSFFAAYVISRICKRYFLLESHIRSDFVLSIEEHLSGRNFAEFDTLNNNMAKIGQKATFVSSLSNPVTRFINAVIYAATAGIGAVLIMDGSFTVGSLVAFLAYAYQYIKPFNDITTAVAEFQNAVASQTRLIQASENSSYV